MRDAYIQHMGTKQIHVLPLPAGALEPSVGEIKRALHDLSDATTGFGSRDYAAVLRQVNDLVRRCARLNGVDPDAAVQRRRDAVQAQRERMLGGAPAAPDPAS
jgi:hypothetical protein